MINRTLLYKGVLIAVLWGLFLPTLTLAQDHTASPSPSPSVIVELEPDESIDSGQDAFTISPALIVAEPGQTAGEIRVTNNSSGLRHVIAYAAGFTVGEDGTMIEEDTSDPWSSSRWFTLTPSELDLDSGEVQLVEWEYKIPDDAPPGDYHTGLFFEMSDSGGNSNIEIRSRIGSFLILSVPGERKLSYELSEFKVPYWNVFPFLTEFTGTSIQARLSNTGNVHLDLRPERERNLKVEIYDWLGNRVDTVQLEGAYVLPGRIRAMEGNFYDPAFFGIYRAHLIIPDIEDVAQIEAERWFVVINLIPILVVLLFGVGIYLLTKDRDLPGRAKRAWRAFKNSQES